jgi:hypothetical protein
MTSHSITTIRTAGPYTITSNGRDVLINGSTAKVRWSIDGAAIKDDAGRAVIGKDGQPVFAIVKTGIVAANGKVDVVSLNAAQVELHLAAVASRRASDHAAWLATPEGAAETQRVKNEREYDRGYNEGAQGYNPYR